MKNAYNFILMIACYFIVNNIYVPAIPLVATDLGASSELVKGSMSSFQIGALISCVIAGFFADFIGKKNFLLIGLSIATLGTLLGFFAANIEILIFARFLQGVGAATGFMMGFALAVDLYEPQETIKIIALNGIVVSIVSVFIPYIGGSLADLFSWRVTFLFMAPLFFIALVNSYVNLPPKSNVKKVNLALGQSLKEYTKLATSMTYLSYAVLNSILLGGMTFALSFLPFYYKVSMGLSAGESGFVIGSTMWLAFGISSFLSVRLYNRFGTDRTIKLALSICATGALLLWVIAYIMPLSLTLITASNVIYFYGFGMLYSGSIAKSMRVFANLTTKASSLRTIMISLFSFTGAFIAQNVSDQNLMNLAVAYIVPVVASTLIFMMRGQGVKG